MDYLDRIDRRHAVAICRGLSAAACACVALAAWRGQLFLASSAAVAALVTVLAANLLRRGAMGLRGSGMVAVVLAVAGALVAAVRVMGGLSSPMLLPLAGLVALAGMGLSALSNLLALSGVSLLYMAMALGSQPAPELFIHLGLLGLLGFTVNFLACQLRRQREELFGLPMRDPLTGALSGSFFHARLVALAAERERIDLVLFELDPHADDKTLEEAGALLLDGVRAGDIVGRVGPCTFAVAVPREGERVAARLGAKLPGAHVRIASASDASDPLERARTLVERAHAA